MSAGSRRARRLFYAGNGVAALVVPAGLLVLLGAGVGGDSQAGQSVRVMAGWPGVAGPLVAELSPSAAGAAATTWDLRP